MIARLNYVIPGKFYIIFYEFLVEFSLMIKERV